MFSRHFNQHHLFRPGSSPQDIYRDAVHELYQYCFSNHLVNAWAYFWTCWYQPKMWKLWARSAFEEIPHLRTTMIVESHWRKIKHQYLHAFSCPRVDLLVWVLITRLQPDYDSKLNFLKNQKNRIRSLTSWRQDFKKEWRKLELRTATLTHETNAAMWICSCEAFVLNRFLLCKHLVQSVHKISLGSYFFHEVKRNYTRPFYEHRELRPINQEREENSDVDGSSDFSNGSCHNYEGMKIWCTIMQTRENVVNLLNPSFRFTTTKVSLVTTTGTPRTMPKTMRLTTPVTTTRTVRTTKLFQTGILPSSTLRTSWR